MRCSTVREIYKPTEARQKWNIMLYDLAYSSTTAITGCGASILLLLQVHCCCCLQYNLSLAECDYASIILEVARSWRTSGKSLSPSRRLSIAVPPGWVLLQLFYLALNLAVPLW